MQTRHGCVFFVVSATARKHDQALLGECQFTDYELTFGSMQLQRKSQLVQALPCIVRLIVPHQW